ncbi:MAG: methyltransferase domain-containing protein [Bacteroidetes bacterium]|nr:methyltransferase domain-containing protein [Bacteroidota bacterium]
MKATFIQCRKNDFDLIYSVDVFEHIKENEMPFADAFEKLRTGGYLMVKMPHITQTSVFPAKWFAEHETWLKHEHPGQVFLLKDLENRFKKAGFDVILLHKQMVFYPDFAWNLPIWQKMVAKYFN